MGLLLVCAGKYMGLLLVCAGKYMGLLLVCAAFAQSFKSQGGGSLREEEDMWGNYLMDRDDNHAEIKAIFTGTCFTCKRIINKVKAKLHGDKNRDNIAAKLDSICRSLGKLKGVCKKLVKKYKEQLIDALVSDVNARVACKKLKLCK
ncbi:antimicrobial peptide NK-lysin-like isoform X1 [Salvelinus fontinalis]|uniref:antimicrobial peptide NK-lysin-like isoform X1 n=1 Tax=Salvelinus fontinalis TaxID=8038 RepID=UPI002484E09F|nr:antimicrobial peptide NK-lysin-like isoform X1 [Salvelinus fontinalis]